MSQLSFSALEIVDVGPARVPTQRLAGIIQQRFVTNQKPSILPVFSSRPLLIFEWLAAQQRLLSFLAQSLDIFRMKDAITKIGLRYVGNGKSRVVQHCVVGINSSAVPVQDRDRLRDTIDYLLKVDVRFWFRGAHCYKQEVAPIKILLS